MLVWNGALRHCWPPYPVLSLRTFVPWDCACMCNHSCSDVHANKRLTITSKSHDDMCVFFVAMTCFHGLPMFHFSKATSTSVRWRFPLLCAHTATDETLMRSRYMGVCIQCERNSMQALFFFIFRDNHACMNPTVVCTGFTRERFTHGALVCNVSVSLSFSQDATLDGPSYAPVSTGRSWAGSGAVAGRSSRSPRRCYRFRRPICRG